MSTAGNLVFQTINDGRLVAYSADSGNQLLEIQTNLGGGMGPPITYQVDGRQYVTLMGGVGQVGEGNSVLGGSARRNPPRMMAFVLDGNAPIPEPIDLEEDSENEDEEEEEDDDADDEEAEQVVN